NYRCIALTAIAEKVYKLLLLNRIQPEIEKALRRNQNGFRKNRSAVGQILTFHRLLEGTKARNLEVVLQFVDFSKAFVSIHRGKSMVRSPDTSFFDIRAEVLQVDTLALFLFEVTLDYVLRTSLVNLNSLGFTLTKTRSIGHLTQNIIDIHYADNLASLSDTISNSYQLLHSLELAAHDIGLC
ncbi:uncharacterized protein LOC106883697, partial [Octopus bimaculoides]|uniref:uncharacterized protein LOC106883697 n=1 Tax=Octopus bimaculoides TaxID=37653 RepID=UPI00071C55BA